MRFFPFRKPTFGLSIGADKLGLVEVCRGWREPSLRRCAERTLPAGLLRLSASEANVMDVSALAKECSTLLDGREKVTRPVPISLSLPDRCARVALFEFDTLPQKPSEVEALIRWRFQKDLNMPVSDARLTYQIFRPHPSPLPGWERGSLTYLLSPGGRGQEVRGEQGGMRGEPLRILAVAIRESVIGPYEQACELAGLIPVSVGLTSLQLFDLCRPVLETALKTARECFYLYVEEGSFAFITIRAGVPVFLRIKSLRSSSRPSPLGGEGEVEGDALRDELLATLHFYMERETASNKAPIPTRPLFLINEGGSAPTLPDSLGVTVVPIGWGDFRIAKQPATVPSCAGLPAFAGLMEM